jgi:predicted amidohydrolase YtcJ
LAELKTKPSSSLFTNCKVWQPDFSFVNSFGIRNSLIDYSGAPKDNYEKIIDLKGKLVLPAFTDGHVHLVYGSLILTRIDCSGIASPQDLREKVRDYSKEYPDKKWLVGANLHIGGLLKNFTKGSSSARLFLDAVTDKPLCIFNYDYHSAICNSLALELSGLNRKTGEFTPDEVPKDFEGKSTGIVKERAMNFMRDAVPPATLEENANAVERMIGVLHSFGITAVSDITKPSDLEVYKLLSSRNKLKVRINSYIPFDEFENLEKYEQEASEIPKDLFKIKGFKAYYDGALGSETGLFKMNYNGKDYNGYKTQMAESGEIIRLAREIDKAGKQIIIHAIGDEAVSGVLNIAEILERENGIRDRRFRIEHAQHIDEADFDRFTKLNVIASVQPLHMKYDIKIVQEKLPPAIVKRTHNYKALIDRNVTVIFGTDFPIVEINPFENIKLAMTRIADDEVFLPQYKIDLHNSLKAYTINNAYASFNEQKSGSIEKGKFADFIVMEDDLFNMSDNDISKARVKSTYFNGEEVYSI